MEQARLFGFTIYHDLIGVPIDSGVCVICLETKTHPVLSKCRHSFCLSCIGQWMRPGVTPCPLCRTLLEPRHILVSGETGVYE